MNYAEQLKRDDAIQYGADIAEDELYYEMFCHWTSEIGLETFSAGDTKELANDIKEDMEEMEIFLASTKAFRIWQQHYFLTINLLSIETLEADLQSHWEEWREEQLAHDPEVGIVSHYVRGPYVKRT